MIMASPTHALRYQPRNKATALSIWDENTKSVRRSEEDVPIKHPIMHPELYSQSAPIKAKTTLRSGLLWVTCSAILCSLVITAVTIPVVILTNKATTTTTASTTTVSTICSTTALTTTVTASSLPSQCTTYNITDDDTRNAAYAGGNTCDSSFGTTPIWYRFVGTGGTLLANCPISVIQCDTQLTGWYSGVYPSLAGSVTSGYVCFNDGSNVCAYSILILITNCNGFYIYYLEEPPGCPLRYCTI